MPKTKKKIKNEKTENFCCDKILDTIDHDRLFVRVSICVHEPTRARITSNMENGSKKKPLTQTWLLLALVPTLNPHIRQKTPRFSQI
jgi:hypothetical protein